MAFDKLPDEILVRILSFLPRSDLLESALTCRRWAQAVAGPPLLRNVWLVIRDTKEAGPVFANTCRQYENLRLDAVILHDFDVAFWTNVGPSLRKLEIIDCKCSSEVFYSILQMCCNLESLKPGTHGFDLWKPELPSGMNVRSIQESMRNLHHLHLYGSHIDTLEFLFLLMPNISSVGLLLDEVEYDVLSRLPNILGASRRITKLKLHSMRGFGSGEEFEQLLRTSSASLLELSIFVWNSSLRGFKAPIYFTMLRDLSIDCWELDAGLLQEIHASVPELESLAIRIDRGSPLTRGDLVPLFDLKKLRKLHLDVKLESDSRSCISEELLREIARMLSLETLVILEGFVDSTGFRILASLPKLRSLELKLVERDVESLKMILFESRKLRTLTIYGNPVRDPGVVRESLASVDRFGSDRQNELESSSLEVLEIFYNPVTDACLSQIAALHTRLKVLHIESCDFITDAGLVTLLQHEPLLEELELHGENNLNGEFLEALGELPCRRLRSLWVHDLDAVSSRAVKAFKLRKPRIKCRFFF